MLKIEFVVETELDILGADEDKRFQTFESDGKLYAVVFSRSSRYMRWSLRGEHS